jgi:hypothetical protein
LTSAFAQSNAKRVLIYHNITPPEFFRGWDDELVRIAAHGRRELSSLARACDLALGDSEFNRQELEAFGFERTASFRFSSTAPYRAEPARSSLGCSETAAPTSLRRPGLPNKRFEDLARSRSSTSTFRGFRFLLVGKAGRMELSAVGPGARGSLGSLGPVSSVTGHAPFEDPRCYRAADLFISMSEHGALPCLLESMLFEVLILASPRAVPDTWEADSVSREELRGVGRDGPSVSTEDDLRDRVVAAGRRRLERFAPERVETELLGFIEEVSA